MWHNVDYYYSWCCRCNYVPRRKSHPDSLFKASQYDSALFCVRRLVVDIISVELLMCLVQLATGTFVCSSTKSVLNSWLFYWVDSFVVLSVADTVYLYSFVDCVRTSLLFVSDRRGLSHLYCKTFAVRENAAVVWRRVYLFLGTEASCRIRE